MLGVIGCVGPWATQELCRMVNSLTEQTRACAEFAR